MKTANILVAGAGHGGLAAAIMLARRGFSVTVLEACAEDKLGYDWRDCIEPNLFADLGIEPLPKTLETMQPISYFPPHKRVCIRPPDGHKPASLLVERKDLVRHLIALAKQSGVRFRFSCTVQSAVLQGTRVTGLRTDDGDVYADLVIDAAGIDSPVRRSLPDACGVVREIPSDNTLYTYRALYENTGAPTQMPVYCAYFAHNGNMGFDWVIREKDAADVLVGSFGSLSPQTVESAVADFRQDHAYIGERIVRGGSYAKIPLRPTLPVFVCGGYAAIGDSASMTEPLSGSGISLSIRAAAQLTDAVVRAADFTTPELWRYVSAYFQKNMRFILRHTMLKDALLRMGPDGIDVMFEKKIMTQKELYGGDQSAGDVLHKITGTISFPSLLPVFWQMLLRKRRLDRLREMLPTEYDEKRVAAWVRAYEAF